MSSPMIVLGEQQMRIHPIQARRATECARKPLLALRACKFPSAARLA